MVRSLSSGLRADAAWAAGLALLTLALYAATLQPDLGGPEDTPKFQFLGYVLGTAHPPGYPLYSMLSYVFVTLVPIGSIVTIKQTYGPDPVIRFNGYPAADILGEADPRMFSSAQAMAKVDEIAAQTLPVGMGYDWSDLSFQEATQGDAAMVVFPLAVLLAFLVLAALYESWTLPLAVILIVPMTLLSALFGVWLAGGDNNVFVQVGLVVLMGLACKNAILIVEFARELELQGKGIVEAALEACRLRLRPIVMTSIAFIAGTVPLVFSAGAGAEVRSVTGITVFAGMLGVTLFGLFLTPVFYVTLRKLANRPLVSHAPVATEVVHA